MEKTSRLSIRIPLSVSGYSSEKRRYSSASGNVMRSFAVPSFTVHSAISAFFSLLPDGVEKGYIVGSTFYKAGDENTEVSAVDITKQKKLYVVCVKGSAKIQTDGQVRYVSEGVTLNGSMAETPEGETSYIIFK